MIEQIKHIDLSNKVYNILKKMIFERQFSGGQKLDLNSLSKDMNISRTPLKDAINQLERDGLVEVFPRKGSYVKKLKVKDIVNMMEMRQMMEKWAIEHLKEKDLDDVTSKLEKVLNESRKIMQIEPFDYNTFLNLDNKFHELIILSHGNERMTETYKSMNIPFQIARVFYFINYDRSFNTQKEHEQIVEALKKNKLQDGVKLLSDHLNVNMKGMVSTLEKNGGAI